MSLISYLGPFDVPLQLLNQWLGIDETDDNQPLGNVTLYKTDIVLWMMLVQRLNPDASLKQAVEHFFTNSTRIADQVDEVDLHHLHLPRVHQDHRLHGRLAHLLYLAIRLLRSVGEFCCFFEWRIYKRWLFRCNLNHFRYLVDLHV